LSIPRSLALIRRSLIPRLVERQDGAVRARMAAL
jgi:hypothetical protein